MFYFIHLLRLQLLHILLIRFLILRFWFHKLDQVQVEGFIHPDHEVNHQTKKNQDYLHLELVMECSYMMAQGQTHKHPYMMVLFQIYLDQ